MCRLRLGMTLGILLLLPTSGCARSDDKAATGRQRSKAETPPGPKIQLDTTEHTGRPEDGIVRHRFEIRNAGAKPLEIAKVESTCGCTTAELPQRVIPPGGSSFLDVSLTATPERTFASVYLHTNDPVNPVVRVGIAATEVPAGRIRLECVPSVLRLVCTTGDTIERRFLVKATVHGPEREAFDLRQLTFDFGTASPPIEVAITEGESEQPLAVIWDLPETSRTDEGISVQYPGQRTRLVEATLTATPTSVGIHRYLLRAQVPVDGATSSALMLIVLDVREVEHPDIGEPTRT